MYEYLDSLLPNSPARRTMAEGGTRFVRAVASSALWWFVLEGIFVVGRSYTQNTFTLNMIHKFSDESKTIAKQRLGDTFREWPRKGSPEYLIELMRHDCRRHGRSLINSNTTFSFAPSDETFVEPFGGEMLISGTEKPSWLHYTYITIGTPRVSFLVALDTGSDLLWVPCDCHQCASASKFRSSASLSVYNSKESSSSKPVLCGDRFCSISPTCKSHGQQCDYLINYSSPNTSSSGTLIEDTLYLIPANGQITVGTTIIFGCGQVQTGMLLTNGAPDGLLGLGTGSISVPSALARHKMMHDSFSMCFSDDSSGRLILGDIGAYDQQTTQFVLMGPSLSGYGVKVEKILVQEKTLPISERMLFDTGTTVTNLPASIYDMITAILDQVVKTTAFKIFPFDHCWNASDINTTQLPTLDFFLLGGGLFTIQKPFISIIDPGKGTLSAACLGIVKGYAAIIGHNFMIGYKFVFDHETMSLGWTPSDCYDFDRVDGPTASSILNETFANPQFAPSQASSPLVKEPQNGVQASTSTINLSSGLIKQTFVIMVFLLPVLLLLRHMHNVNSGGTLSTFS